MGITAMTACDHRENPLGGIACTAIYVYGINVQVLDSLSGAVVPTPMIISAHDGTFADTSQYARQPQAGLNLSAWPLVGERAGMYTVRVLAAGFQSWEQTGVRVSRNECHVIPVTVIARLRR